MTTEEWEESTRVKMLSDWNEWAGTKTLDPQQRLSANKAFTDGWIAGMAHAYREGHTAGFLEGYDAGIDSRIVSQGD